MKEAKLQAYPPPKRRLDSLEIGRGLAALAVVFYHSNLQLEASPFGEVHWIFRGGSTGVEYFFVLSGFLMMYLYRAKFGEKQDAKQFLIKRVERIYPLYWIIALPLLAISLVGIGGNVEDGQIFTSVTLLPTAVQPRLAVAWTLVYEMYFYFLFAIALAMPRLGLVLGMAVAVGAIVSSFIGPLAFPLKFFIAPIVLLFGMGMLAALAVQRVGRLGLALVAVGAIIFAVSATGMAAGYVEAVPASLLCGVGAALAMTGLVARDKQSGAWARPLVALGGASYALYLIHYPVVSVVGKASAVLTPWMPNWAVMALSVLASLVAGFAVHYLVERPVMRWLKSRGSIGQRVRPSLGAADL